MTEQGMIFGVDDLKRQLAEANRSYDGRRTWEALYGAIDLSKQRALSEVSQDYSKSITDAYASAYQNKLSMLGSDLGQGYQDVAIDELNLALNEAYDTYRNTYLSNIADIEANVSKATGELDTALTEQAEYTKKMAKAPYQYLQYLFNKYDEGLVEDNIFYNDDLWKRYTYEELDEQGQPTGRRLLKPWEELAASGSYETYTDELGNVHKEWTGLFDDSSALTIKGAEFYDQMLNYFDYLHPGKDLGFGSWLAQTDSELFDWATSYNPYDYTEAGTNAGSFKTMVGLTSKDQEYQFIERFSGYTKSELDSLFSDIETNAKRIAESTSKYNAKNSTKLFDEYSKLLNDIKTVTDRLEITQSLEKDMGMTFEELSTKLANRSSTAKSNTLSEAAGEAFIATNLNLTPEALSKSGPVLGLIQFVDRSITNQQTNKKENEALVNAQREEFDSLIAQLVAYGHKQRRQSQSDFYSYNK